MKKKLLIHKIAYWLLNISCILCVLQISSNATNEDNLYISPLEYLIPIILLFFLGIIYYSWWELWKKANR